MVSAALCFVSKSASLGLLCVACEGVGDSEQRELSLTLHRRLITLCRGNNAIKTVAKCKREMAPKEEVLIYVPKPLLLMKT